MPEVSARQLTLHLDPGLVERWPSAMDYLRYCLHTASRPMKSIAADMDLSASDLSRKLSENPSDPRRFSVADLERYIAVTGDTRPLLWFVERFLGEQRDRREVILEQLSTLLPALQQLVAGETAAKGRR